MARKTSTIRSTRKQKGAAKPAAAKKEPATTPDTTSTKKDDEGWGPIGDAAKKMAKGAVKGAANEVLKKNKK